MHKKHTPKARATLFVSLVVAGFLPVSAIAEGGTQVPATTPAFSFDWRANGSDRSKESALAIVRERRILASSSMGDGTWICSPAGFGRKSHCTRN